MFGTRLNRVWMSENSVGTVYPRCPNVDKVRAPAMAAPPPCGEVVDRSVYIHPGELHVVGVAQGLDGAPPSPHVFLQLCSWMDSGDEVWMQFPWLTFKASPAASMSLRGASQGRRPGCS